MGVQRQARGEERHRRILRATLGLIEQRGVDAVTHRAVGEASGVPLGSVTYYFPTKDALLREALEFWVSDEIARLEEVAAEIEREQASPEEAAARWSELLRGNDPHQLAQFELYLQAARVPELRSAVAAAFVAYERVAAAALRAAGLSDPARAAPVFVALADGLGLRRLADPGTGPAAEDALVDLFEALRSRPA
jgi:DNA-binding transcriptional regulator YbjK